MLSVGDRVTCISSDISHRDCVGRTGTVARIGGYGPFDMIAVAIDGRVGHVNMYYSRFKPLNVELKYDPMQQGDKDEDI